MNPQVPPPLATQRVIRIAQIMAPAMFLAVVMFIRPQDADPEATRPLMVGFSILFLIVAAALMFVLKPRRDKEQHPHRIFVLNLVGGAMAEAIALFGGVIALLGGPIYPALVGILFTAFVLFFYFPVPSEQ
jgi:F0F1-type ATP synthase membrane subunit c/vacuolar-type H+-ATPase subunit K